MSRQPFRAPVDLHRAAAFGEVERLRELDVLQFTHVEGVVHVRGHQRVLVERRVLRGGRGAHVDVAPVGDVDVAAVEAVEHAFAHWVRRT